MIFVLYLSPSVNSCGKEEVSIVWRHGPIKNSLRGKREEMPPQKVLTGILLPMMLVQS
ncbi:MAG: hypothetical protein LBR79_06365 [Oscillospiraceae bacterium]|jgi:hypothetical protein|nr:hypothetical protein [Oscillospiraceae bacterium]